jgi:hypothetical protein
MNPEFDFYARSRPQSPRRRRTLLILAAAAALSSHAAFATIKTPAHIVVVIEEDRATNAIGDSNMPYFNQLAATGLVYGNSHAENTPAQQGEMDYLALYSGDTQGVTDESNDNNFSGPNLAQSLNNTAGRSFKGYSESMPSDGYQGVEAPGDGDPNNPNPYPDLYMRVFNPMAMFTNAGTGKTNADVSKTFAEFPTNFSNLPTVSFVIPNVLHSTHGSNDADPFATDPNAYDQLRSMSDTWLQQNMDSYLQWAKTNNSLLIVTGDEEDRAHPGDGLTTIINGDPSLFLPGTNLTNFNHYNTLRTIEDMYGLSPLGNSATTTAYQTNASGQLIPIGAAKHWDGSTNAFTTTHWLNTSNTGPYFTSPGDTLTIGSGTASFSPTTTGQFLTLSNTSSSGQELDVTGGQFNITVGGSPGAGYGLLLDQSAVLNVTSGSVSIAGPLSIGHTANNTASATFSGGTITLGAATGTGTVRILYVGDNGTGTVTQSGNASVTVPTIILAFQPNATGTYNLNGGALTTSSLEVNADGTFNWNAGSLSAAADLIVQGTVNLAANASTGILPRTVSGVRLSTGGKFQIADPANHGNRSVLITSSLSFGKSIDSNWQGQLDLTSNDLIVHNGNLANLTSQLQSGFNHGSGYWNGQGILSSTAANDPTFLTTLGIMQAANGTTFDNQSVSQTDILIKYTYYGDADLSGKVDGTDYSMIDVGFNSHGVKTGWQNGDFNYDGKIDGSDYSLIDNAFNLQGSHGLASPMNQTAIPTAQFADLPASVPEPSATLALFVLGFGLVRRRKTRYNGSGRFPAP